MPTKKPQAPLIALVGRTNVGKSTLFNRLTHRRKALVAPTPGLTRDRREEEVRRDGLFFRVADTGGLEFDSSVPLSTEIARQVDAALAEASVIWFVVDAAAGLTPLDEEIHRWLLRRGKPMLVIANKSDHTRRREETAEFFTLGAAEIYPLSAIHGRGVDDALEATANVIPSMRVEDSGAGAAGTPSLPTIRVALIGRPNVGKSSLVNAILGEARMIVSDLPGTTREPVDSQVEFGARQFTLIDTAGLRRKARTVDPIEKLGAITSIGALERCDVAVLVLDAEQGIADQDAKIASYILDQRRGIVIALNKWDAVENDGVRAQRVSEAAEDKLRFLDFATTLRTSARTGIGIKQLFQEVQKAYEHFTREVQTADLNRVIEAVSVHHAPPSKGRSATRILYGTQVSSRPPVFRFFCNHLEKMSPAYTRYFADQLRYHFDLSGTPIDIQWRNKDKNPRKPPNPKVAAGRGGPR